MKDIVLVSSVASEKQYLFVYNIFFLSNFLIMFSSSLASSMLIVLCFGIVCFTFPVIGILLSSWFYCFHQIWQLFTISSGFFCFHFHFCFPSPSISYPLEIAKTRYLAHEVVLQLTDALPLLSLYFILEGSSCCGFKFTNIFFCRV